MLLTDFTYFRIAWTIALLGASIFFMWFMGTKLVYYYTYPKTVDVDVTYNTSMRFPAVTFCNQNPFRYITPLLINDNKHKGFYIRFVISFQALPLKHSIM